MEITKVLCEGYMIRGEKTAIKGGLTLRFKVENIYFITLTQTAEDCFEIASYKDKDHFKKKKKKNRKSLPLSTIRLTGHLLVHNVFIQRPGEPKEAILVLIHAKYPIYFKPSRGSFRKWLAEFKKVAAQLDPAPSPPARPVPTAHAGTSDTSCPRSCTCSRSCSCSCSCSRCPNLRACNERSEGSQESHYVPMAQPKAAEGFRDITGTQRDPPPPHPVPARPRGLAQPHAPRCTGNPPSPPSTCEDHLRPPCCPDCTAIHRSAGPQLDPVDEQRESYHGVPPVSSPRDTECDSEFEVFIPSEWMDHDIVPDDEPRNDHGREVVEESGKSGHRQLTRLRSIKRRIDGGRIVLETVPVDDIDDGPGRTIPVQPFASLDLQRPRRQPEQHRSSPPAPPVPARPHAPIPQPQRLEDKSQSCSNIPDRMDWEIVRQGKKIPPPVPSRPPPGFWRRDVDSGYVRLKRGVGRHGRPSEADGYQKTSSLPGYASRFKPEVVAAHGCSDSGERNRQQTWARDDIFFSRDRDTDDHDVDVFIPASAQRRLQQGNTAPDPLPDLVSNTCPNSPVHHRPRGCSPDPLSGGVDGGLGIGSSATYGYFPDPLDDETCVGLGASSAMAHDDGNQSTDDTLHPEHIYAEIGNSSHCPNNMNKQLTGLLLAQKKSGAVEVEISKYDAEALVYTDFNGKVCIVSWKKEANGRAKFQQKMHIGDELIRVNGQNVSNALDASIFVRTSAGTKVKLALNRLPFARVLHVTKAFADSWGCEFVKNELVRLFPGPIMEAGLSEMSFESTGKESTWIATECNHQPVPILNNERDEMKNRLLASPLELSLVLHTRDFIDAVVARVKKCVNNAKELADYQV